MKKLDVVRVGVVGGGRVGEGFLNDFQHEKNVAVTAVVTSTAARQQELSDKYSVAAFGSVEAMLASAHKPDIVFVLNANEDHCAATVAALKAGCHVYCEKPMAPTLAECRSMLEAERAGGVHLQIGFEYMHGTMTSRLMQLISEGYFGDVLWASMVDSRGHWWAGDPDAPLEEQWKLDRKRGGGIVFHCGIHQLDMLRCYLGAIESVTAFRPPRNPLPYYPDDVPSNVTLMLKAVSGAVCNFQIFHDRAPCYYRENPAFHPDWHKVPGHEFGLSLIGSAAACKMSIYDEELHLFRYDHARKDIGFDRTEVFGPQHPDKSHHDMHGLMVRFIRNIAEGKGAVDSAVDAFETMRLAFAAEDAIVSSETVYIKDY